MHVTDIEISVTIELGNGELFEHKNQLGEPVVIRKVRVSTRPYENTIDVDSWPGMEFQPIPEEDMPELLRRRIDRVMRRYRTFAAKLP